MKENVIWMRMRVRMTWFGPNFNQFWDLLGSQNCSKIHQKMFLSVPFLEPFFEVLKLFKCLLGAFLNLLCSSWEASGPPKPEKKQMLFQGFCKRSFFGLWSSQWPSWTHLGAFLARSDPKTVPEMTQKSTPKWSKKWLQQLPPKIRILRRFWAPIWDHFGVKWPLKIQGGKLAGTIRPAYGTPKTF